MKHKLNGRALKCLLDCRDDASAASVGRPVHVDGMELEA